MTLTPQSSACAYCTGNLYFDHLPRGAPVAPVVVVLVAPLDHEISHQMQPAQWHVQMSSMKS